MPSVLLFFLYNYICTSVPSTLYCFLCNCIYTSVLSILYIFYQSSCGYSVTDLLQQYSPDVFKQLLINKLWQEIPRHVVYWLLRNHAPCLCVRRFDTPSCPVLCFTVSYLKCFFIIHCIYWYIVTRHISKLRGLHFNTSRILEVHISSTSVGETCISEISYLIIRPGNSTPKASSSHNLCVCFPAHSALFFQMMMGTFFSTYRMNNSVGKGTEGTRSKWHDDSSCYNLPLWSFSPTAPQAATGSFALLLHRDVDT